MSDEVDIVTGELVPANAGPDYSGMIEPVTDSWLSVWNEVGDLARSVAETEFVPKGIRGSTHKTAATILFGRELGLPPMTSLASVDIIEGRPNISAEMMRALVVQAGHQIGFDELGTERVVMRGRRAGDEEWTRVTWTTDDARRAGLLNKSNWKSYPRAMLAARATGELCRLVFADVIHGLAVLEEVQDDDAGEPVVAEPAGESRVVQRQPAKAAPAKRRTTSKPVEKQEAAPPPPPERKRPELSRPAPPPPAPESEPKVVDAVVVEDQDDEQQPTATEAPPTAGIRPGQRAQLQAQFVRLGIDREERLMWLGVITGREVSTANALSEDEASAVISVVEKCRDSEALEAWGREKDAQDLLPDGGESNE